ncbi:cytochrome c [Aquicoccus sp. SCR17]|nr:cytochrome c [Carideicomes alvinocaridis]
MRRMTLPTLAAVFIAGAVTAHEAANPVVAERMELMEGIRDQLKVIGGMAQGKMDFDADKAAEARAALIEHASQIPDAFEPQETDPESEAKPAIWENWSDFESHAEALEAAATDLSTDDLDALRAGLGKIGGACKACHETYRAEK